MSINFKECNKKTITSVVKDAEAFAIRDLFYSSNKDVLCILSDGVSVRQVKEVLSFIAPEIDILILPNWDTVPYDRVSPNTSIISKRIETLSKLALEPTQKNKRLILTSVGAAIQKHPPKKVFFNSRKTIYVGD